MKKQLWLVFLFSLCAAAFSFELSYEVPEENYIDDEEASFDEFDSLFEEAADLTEAVQTKEVEQVAENNPASSTYGIRLSGHFDTGIGYGMIFDSKSFDQTGYLNFQNYFYIRARPVYAVTFYTDLYTGLISGNPALGISTMYIDYNMWDKVFVSVGKKSLNWTNTRLFDGNTMVGTSSSSTLLGTVNVPAGKFNFTFAGLYGGTLKDERNATIDKPVSTDVSIVDVHYAENMDLVLWGALIRLSAHQWHPAKPGVTYPTEFALELKRTFWGFDVYAHGDLGCKFSSAMTNESFSNYRGIGGFYRKWNAGPYELGVNIECRHVYNFADSSNTVEIGEELGWNKLCNNKLALALAGYHNITAGTGYITPGFVVKNVFPNANLNTGLTIKYAPDSVNFVLGTKLTLSLDY